MINSQKIAREALKELLENGQDPTPDAYCEAYNNQAKKMGENPVKHSTDRMLDLINKEARELLFNKTFKNKDDLIIALIKNFNQIFFYKKSFFLQGDLIKIFLRILTSHPLKEISHLSKSFLLEIDNITQTKMQVLRDKWMEIAKKNVSEESDNTNNLEVFLNLNIQNKHFIDWKNRLKIAIANNKMDIQMQIAFLREFETIFQDAKEKSAQSKKKKSTFKDMDLLKMDSKTTLLTRESINLVLDFAESEYQKDRENFSIIVFGIASYDELVKKFGLEATQRVVATLGRLLKKYSSSSDLLATYSDQEFLACLLGRDKDEAIAFIKNIDNAVRESIFMYKEIRINIHLSAQASHRANEADLDKMLKTTLLNFQKSKNSTGAICGT